MTADFDAPEFWAGQSVGSVHQDVWIRPAGTVLTPTNVTTLTGSQALRSTATCTSAACPNHAYWMEVRLGSRCP